MSLATETPGQIWSQSLEEPNWDRNPDIQDPPLISPADLELQKLLLEGTVTYETEECPGHKHRFWISETRAKQDVKEIFAQLSSQHHDSQRQRCERNPSANQWIDDSEMWHIRAMQY